MSWEWRCEDGWSPTTCEGIERRRMEQDSRVASLALRYRLGERDVLGELYGELELSIRGFLSTLIMGRPLPACLDAEDLYQQSYVVLAEIVLKWNPDRNGNFIAYFLASFPWWMGRYLRKQSTTQRATSVQLYSLPHDQLVERMAACQGADGREWDDLLGVEDLLAGLPRLGAQVVRLHLYHGLSFADVSKALGIGRSDAHRRYCRAMVRLRALIEASVAGG